MERAYRLYHPEQPLQGQSPQRLGYHCVWQGLLSGSALDCPGATEYTRVAAPIFAKSSRRACFYPRLDFRSAIGDPLKGKRQDTDTGVHDSCTQLIILQHFSQDAIMSRVLVECNVGNKHWVSALVDSLNDIPILYVSFSADINFSTLTYSRCM